ncbi:MAG TPA: glycosyltransferase family 2 protein [Bryobacteraceae bacterium]|nr:glycosyltransferase family 2 protein [Bryobacteraceae bacterium]
MAAIGIVIVTYNSAAEIGACVDAALTSGAELIVVDNASKDGTVAEVKRRNVRLIANLENRGFAAAVNQGFRALSAQYILILNPDAAIEHGLADLQEACDLSHSAGACGRLIGDDAESQIGFMVRRLPTPSALIAEALLLNRLWPGNRINRRYRALDLDYSRQIEVEQPAGAFLMVRRAVWEELNGFDEGFFPLWFEDVDFCRRIRDRGYRLYYVPKAVAKHTGGHSIVRIPVEMRRFYWYRSLLRYSARHFQPGSFRLVCLAVVTGSILRMFGEAVLDRSLQPLVVYGKVARLASRCLCFGWGTE